MEYADQTNPTHKPLKTTKAGARVLKEDAGEFLAFYKAQGGESSERRSE